MSGRKKQETYIQSLEGMTRKHSQAVCVFSVIRNQTFDIRCPEFS